jgi:molecular chaperone HscB
VQPARARLSRTSSSQRALAQQRDSQHEQAKLLERACRPRARRLCQLLTSSTSQCGSTRADGDLYFCNSCHTILPPSPEHDFFALLGVPRHFDVAPSQLELAFKEAQKLLHPDKFTTRSEAEQRHSAAQAARVNSAYTTLRSPLARARYLLKLLGAPDAEEENATLRQMPPEMLEMVMEAREEAERSKGSLPALRRMQARLAQQMELCERELSYAFNSNLSAEQLGRAQRAADELAYLTRLQEDLEQKAHELNV